MQHSVYETAAHRIASPAVGDRHPSCGIRTLPANTRHSCIADYVRITSATVMDAIT
jgi:hypothetical protein